MEEFFDEKFYKFYCNLNEYQQSVIKWCLVANPYCPTKCFEIIYDELQSKIEKDGLKENYFGKKQKDKYYPLEQPNDYNLQYLNEILNELDGTLLVDLVRRYVTNHQVFHNDKL